MTLAEHARKYSELGWALLPLNGKNPIGWGWQNTTPISPEDSQKNWEWREQQGGYNMGLVLGPSGVIDFELDSGDEDLYWDLVKDVITPVYTTGTGKPHHLFRDPGGLTRRTVGGLELRAGPHQSVLPPSIHPDTGRPYEWVVPPNVPLADPPQALLDFFSEPNKGQGESHWRGPLSLGKLGVGEGRHHSLISFCGRMKNACETPEQLVEAAMVYSELYHDPPYPESHIETTALYAWDNYREDAVPEDPELASEYLHIESLDKIQMKSVEFLWEPFLQKNAFHMLVGRKNAGKGSLLAWVAARVTQGEFGRARKVLWISTEDSFGIDLKPRIVAQGGIEESVLAVKQKVIFPRDLPALRAVCGKEDVGLVVIDPIISVLGGGNANDEASVYDAIGPLNDLSDNLDTAVVGVRHIGKNAAYDGLESVLGSVAWVNIPRAVLNVAQTESTIPMGGVTKTVTLDILASNRVRPGNPAFFSLVETSVAEYNKPVPKVIPANAG